MMATHYVCPHCGKFMRISTYEHTILRYLSQALPFPKDKGDTAYKERTPAEMSKALKIPIAPMYRAVRALVKGGYITEFPVHLEVYRGQKIAVYMITDLGRKEIEADVVSK